MKTARQFEDFEVWYTSRDITRRIYCLTRQRDFVGDFALIGQIRRASISIMSNIAEGYETQTRRTFIRHLGIAKGSAGEVRSQLYIALDQDYITQVEFSELTALITRVSRQLSALIHYLSSQKPKV